MLKFQTVHQVAKRLKPHFPELSMYVTPDPSVEDDGISISEKIDIQIGYDYIITSIQTGQQGFQYLPSVSTYDELISQIKGAM